MNSPGSDRPGKRCAANKMLPVSLFDFDLPDELIARYPAEQRDGSRMLVLDRRTGDFEIRPFTALPEYLTPGDALVCNNALVRRARMYGRKEGRPDGALFELLLLAPDTEGAWNVMLKPGKRATPGTHVQLLDAAGNLPPGGDSFTVLAKNPDNSYKIEFSDPRIEKLEMRYGHIPLPPYLNRKDEPIDAERYQTVYAEIPGAVAAPTAGLHFTPEILETLRKKGVRQAALNLRVGAGTFLPVKTEYAEEHKMHSEHFDLNPAAAELVNSTRRQGKKVLAVGTTTVRTLESCAAEDDTVTPREGDTRIFLYPPYRIRSVDMLLTNFHLPKSTLVMLVAAFAGYDNIMKAYAEAVKERYRFFSFGDAMLIV